MRTTRILSVTLPPAMLKEARELAKRENRTMSELVREALRRYQREQRWEKIRSIGTAKTRSLGLREEDVVPLVHEFRREQRAKKKIRKRKVRAN
ncbi:MAG: ribbon-helix-helix protein, CopG family [Acidobacteria bacterium]|nr:ribbon-helix-helix protein, CopG family [Acidobacteriota bacterium]